MYVWRVERARRVSRFQHSSRHSAVKPCLHGAFSAQTPKPSFCPSPISPDELLVRLETKTGLQDLVLENNRDHLISGRAYNTTGYTLQLFEYLGRNSTVSEMVAASEDPKLTERSVVTGIRKLNEILYKLLGLRIQHDKESGALRLVNQNDAIMATENFARVRQGA